jgi:YesN/AraC family two-component response regulator
MLWIRGERKAVNILVVEDEPLALDDLLGMLRPFAGAHRIIGCPSGAEALASAAISTPDLVITDIRMPEIDGLELVSRLKKQAAHLVAIVLSGYSEFEYARAGLRLGITDYLLKPVPTDTLRLAVARALAEVADARARDIRVREAQLARLLLGGQRAASAEPNLLAGLWGLIILICENWESPTIWRDTPIDRQFIAQALALAIPRPCDIIDLEGRCRIVLMQLEGPRRHLLETAALQLHQAILDAGVAVHTTFLYKGADERPERVVSEGLHRLSQEMRFATPTFVRPGVAPQEVASVAIREHTQLMARALNEGKLFAAIDELYMALHQLQRDGATQPAALETLDALFALLQAHARSAAAVRLPDRAAISTAIRSSQTYEQLAQWVDIQLKPLRLRQRGAITPRQLVRALVAQVQTTYADDISLQAFASEHNVSLAYFSRLFKDEVGVTFSDFLIRVRIEKAKELLAAQDLRISDISLLVGYDDPKYFGQIFRKVAGESPVDYQRKNQRSQS